MSRLAAIACSLFLTTSLFAADSSPLPKVPDGFQCEIVLQAPDIEAPTALCVASNGDVYFAEDPMDMRGPPTKNIDKIWMLKGGDPKKKVLIADKMWAVMGLEIVGNKLYVVHAPHVTVFTLDDEGKPTKREELFDDLGPPVAGVPSFNDHIPSGIRMGMDGWLYVSIGDKGIPKMTRKEKDLMPSKEKDQGSVHVAEGRWRHTSEGNHISLEGGGVIRFRPDGSGLEVFASGTRNHLDVPMDEHDRIFVRDNTDDGDGWNTRFMYLPRGGFMGYPWAFKQRPKETLPMIHDFGGGAPCGGWVYCDDGLPEKYRGRVFHCEWGQGKVWAVKVAPDGAGFKYVDQIAFMDPSGTAVKDFRPFTIRPTADGRGFYVTDWGLSGWLQKVERGRIFKVTYTKDDVKPKPRGKDTDSIEELVKALDHPAHSERLRAQRALSARGKDAVDPLIQMLQEKGDAAPARRHGLWCLAELGESEAVSLQASKAFMSPDTDLRMEACRVLGSLSRSNTRIDALLFGAIVSAKDPQIRLQAALAYGQRQGPAPSVFDMLKEEKDASVKYALVRALKQRLDFTDVAEALKPSDKINKLPEPALDILFLTLTEEFDSQALLVLYELQAHTNPAVRVRAVATLSRIYMERKPYSGTWWGTRPEQQKPPARNVAWSGTPWVRDRILAALRDNDADVRKAAVVALVSVNDPATLDPLVAQFGKEKADDTRTDIVRAVAAVQSEKSQAFLTDILKGKNPEAMVLEAIAGLEKYPGAAEVLAAAATGEGSKTTTPERIRAFEALATLKAKSASTACAAGLKDEAPGVRRAAATTLGNIGDSEAAALLLPLLADKDTAVRSAAIQALGKLKAKSAIPALLQASSDEATQFDAIMALTAMPDKHALTAYLAGLVSKNQDVRKASAQAINAVREEVLPDLQELVKRNEVRAEALPELRAIYLSYSPIVDWKLIGPFPGLDKAHPPETELKFDAKYEGAGKQVAWRLKQKGDAKNHGRVNLAALFSPTDDVVVYGYTEIEAATARDAELLVGSDDTMTIWVNGKQVFHFGGNRGWSYNADKVKIHLDQGKNTLLIKCGNASGPWEFSVAVTGDVEKYAFLKGGVQKFDLETFRAFARKNSGEAERGKKLFNDVKGLACIKCHSVAGEGGKVGPDLAGIALKYKREDLMTSVLEPSKVIAQGYETIIIMTTRGQTITGVFKGETAEAINVMDKDGKALVVLKKDVDERKFSPISTMPNGLNEGMTLQDFADVIAFLEARREEKTPPKKE
jgi:putative membrane-bound dehydrogenase-like protein